MFKQEVEKVLNEVKEMLVKKNLSYGNSALNPLRVFSKADAKEGLKVRIDDKLSRIARGQDIREDDVKDLLGYLVLLRIKQNEGSVVRLTEDNFEECGLNAKEIDAIMSELQKRQNNASR